jgi:hypothetical protein
MDIVGINPGDQVGVTLTFPADLQTGFEYIKYYSNSGNWVSYPYTQIDNRTIRISLTDGGNGDGDGLRNGVISDPSGITVPKPEVLNNYVTFSPIISTYRTTADTSGCLVDEVPAEYVGKFSFDARLKNKNSSPPLSDLEVKVVTLTNGNLLQNADGGPGGVGSTLTVPKKNGYSDGVLSPQESVDVPFVICLKDKKPFRFFVDVLGFPDFLH